MGYRDPRRPTDLVTALPVVSRRHTSMMICRTCSATTLDDARFCTSCGASLFDALDDGERQDPTASQPPPAQRPPPVVRRRRRDAPADHPPAQAPSAPPNAPDPPDPTGVYGVTPAPAGGPQSGSARPGPAHSGPPTQVTPGNPAPSPQSTSRWDVGAQGGGAATAVHDLSSPELPRAASIPLPAPAPASAWSAPPARAPAPAQARRQGTGRWARILAGIVSLWLPISALMYLVADQGDLLQSSGLEVLAILTPTRLPWAVWSSGSLDLGWTIPLRLLVAFAAFGALVILAAWMARNRQAMRVGLIFTGAIVTAFAIVWTLWLTVGLELPSALTTAQAIRRVYLPGSVSLIVGVLLMAVSPVAARSR
ncbi:MAG: hypothetical protein R2754_01455 [Microthrixaceae bacterium]